MRRRPLLALATATSTLSLSAVGVGLTSVAAGSAAGLDGANRLVAARTPIELLSVSRQTVRVLATVLRPHAVGHHAVHHGRIGHAARALTHAATSHRSDFIPLGGTFARLRNCESRGNYQEDSGNGYYGAYQFSLTTWHGLGGSGLPSAASPSEQDSMAKLLQSRRGWQPWPGCSYVLGLG